MPDIFISYRRGDSAGHAGRLYDGLVSRFHDSQVFIDVDAIAPGIDFVERIQEAVQSCDVVLVLIGDKWVSMQGQDGGRRLDDPEDFVRLEISAALERGVPVVPVLVEGARMPGPTDLPDDIRGLARQNAIELSDARWHYDVSRLIEAVSRLGPQGGKPAAAAAAPTRARPSRGLLAAAGAALLAVIVVVALVAGGGGGGGKGDAKKAAPPTAQGVQTGKRIDHLAAGGGALWSSEVGGTVRRFDPETGKPLGEPVSVAKSVNQIAFGQNAAWVLSNDDRSVVKVDQATGRPTSTTLALPDFADDVAAGAGGVWVTVQRSPGLVRYDPGSGEVVAQVKGIGPAAQVAIGDFDEVAVTAQGAVHFVDPDTNEMVRRVKVGSTADGLAWGTGEVWVASPEEGIVSVVGESDGAPKAVTLGGAPHEVAVGENAVWVLDTEHGKLFEVDPEKVAAAGPAVDVGKGASGLTAAGDGVWVGYEDGRLRRVDG